MLSGGPAAATCFATCSGQQTCTHYSARSKRRLPTERCSHRVGGSNPRNRFSSDDGGCWRLLLRWCSRTLLLLPGVVALFRPCHARPVTGVREHLACLAKATDEVTLGPFGAGAVVSAQAESYNALLTQPEQLVTLRPELETMCRSGPPAARIYAALLLHRIDEKAGTAALEVMAGSDDERPCRYSPGGCASMGERLSDVAHHLRGRSPPPDPTRSIARALHSLARTRIFEMPPDDPAARSETSWVQPLQALQVWRNELPSAHTRLQQLACEAPPAGRLYAALALREIDPDAGRTALVRLATDEMALWEIHTEGESYTTVASIARRFLTHDELALLPSAPADPPPPRKPRRRRWYTQALDWLGDRISEL